MRNVDPEKCKPEHSGGRPGLEVLAATAGHTPGSVIEKLMSSGILGLQRRGWAEGLGPGDRDRDSHKGLALSFAIEKPPKKLNLKPLSM